MRKGESQGEEKKRERECEGGESKGGEKREEVGEGSWVRRLEEESRQKISCSSHFGR